MEKNELKYWAVVIYGGGTPTWHREYHFFFGSLDELKVQIEDYGKGKGFYERYTIEIQLLGTDGIKYLTHDYSFAKKLQEVGNLEKLLRDTIEEAFDKAWGPKKS